MKKSFSFHVAFTSAVLAASAAFLWSGQAMAEPPGVSALTRLLSTSGMGKITKVFDGPDGMTGVVLEKGLKHTIAYLTPNGHYVFFGMMLDLQNDKNKTLEEGEKLIRNYHIINGPRAADATALAYRMHAITYGNPKSDNQIIVVFNTQTKFSKFAVAKTLEQAHEKLVGKMVQQMCYRLIPTGPSAGWMLSGKLPERRKRLYEYLRGKFSGQATTNGTNRGNYNTNALRSFPVSPPFSILDLPAVPMDSILPIRPHTPKKGG